MSSILSRNHVEMSQHPAPVLDQFCPLKNRNELSHRLHWGRRIQKGKIAKS